RPGARLTRRLVCTVEVQHNLVLGGFFEQNLIKVNNLFGFMVEKIYLRTNYPNRIEKFEKLLSRFRRSKIATMFPEPYANFVLSGKINKLAHLGFAPFLPETFHNIIFKAKLSG